MGVLSDLEPKEVFEFFEEICAIPRSSGNSCGMVDYLCDFARDRNLEYKKDDFGNVVIKKDATVGYEKSDPLILQSHIDMVAVKNDDVDVDFEKSGPKVEVNDGIVSARGTSLGADDGIGAAYMLALLDSDDIPHPPVEAVFTADEEVGMLGALALDTSNLKGRMLINLDSEDEGVFTLGCAGGVTAVCALPYNIDPVNGAVVNVKISGFAGGHSGTEIAREGVNANCAMGRIMLGLIQKLDIRIADICGGEKENAIPTSCSCSFAVLPEKCDEAVSIIESVFDEIKSEYKSIEPGAKIDIDVSDAKLVETMSGPSSLALVILLANFPDGIQRMNPDVEGMVQTSLNLGILRMEKNAIKFTYAVRSSSDSEKNFLVEKLRSLTEIFGGSLETSGDYPGWEYRADSKLREVMEESYREIYKEEPIEMCIHAGLECGVFASKIDDLDAVSIGPQIKDAHTVGETLDADSTARTWELIKLTLGKLR